MNRFISLRRIAIALLALGLAGVASQALADNAVPFTGLANVAITGVVPAEDGLHITTEGSGLATHLGRYTRVEHIVLHDDGSIEGSIVFKAANGDLLFVNVSGGFTSEKTAEGTYTIMGGTGRFTDASGSASWLGVTSDGAHFALTFEGTIDF
jgi:hypothetical protein